MSKIPAAAFSHLAALTHTVHLKNIFCQINANYRSLCFWMPPSMVSGNKATTTLAF